MCEGAQGQSTEKIIKINKHIILYVLNFTNKFKKRLLYKLIFTPLRARTPMLPCSVEVYNIASNCKTISLNPANSDAIISKHGS